MLRQSTFLVCAILGVVAVSGASGLLQKNKQKQPPKAPPTAPKKIVPATPPKTSPSQGDPEGDRSITPLQPAPNLSLSLNLLHDARVSTEKSLLIEAALSAYNGKEGTKEFKLAKPGGAWSDFLLIEVRDSNNKVVSGLTIKPLIKTGDSILLNEKQMGWMAWEADFNADTKLALGTYTVVAILDGKSIGLDQKVASPPSKLEVIETTADFSEDDARILALSEARLLGYQGKDAEAVAVCERHLSKFNNDPLMLEEKGDLLMKMNRLSEALAAYNEALENVSPLPNEAVPEPPFGLIRKQQLAEDALLAGKSQLNK